MTATATWTDWSCDVSLTVTDGACLAQARARLTHLMQEVELAVSRFRDDSDLSAVNRSAGRLVPVGRRTVQLVDVALDAASQTGGIVDPTIGNHLVRLGYVDDIAAIRGRLVPGTDDSAADAWVGRQPDYRRVRVDHDLCCVGVPSGLALDLGATAKAWTADTAARGIAADLHTGVLVEIGGDVAVAGRCDAPWEILVSEQAGQPGEQVGLASGGLATSSTAARRWRTATGDVHHIVDPRTGRPAEGPWRTATVWADSAVEANIDSTAAIVLGGDAVAHLVERGHAARLVGHDGHVEHVGDWPTEGRAA